VNASILRAGVVVVLALAGNAAVAAELMPHRALYKMTLTSSRGGSGIETVQGEMIADWSESCDGWTLDQRSVFDVGYSSGQNLRIVSNISTWESRDGLQYRFNVTNKTNEEVTERTEGHARLSGEKGGGTAEFEQPDASKTALPKGTIFPTEHSRQVLRDLGGAPMILSHTVFDGLTDGGPLQVSTVVGGEVAPDTTTAMAALKGLRSWPVQMAFFKAGAGASEPDQEIGMRLYENGVGEAMVLDFGEFKVRANLVKLDVDKHPSCGR
jgi:hypothetical protein